MGVRTVYFQLQESRTVSLRMFFTLSRFDKINFNSCSNYCHKQHQLCLASGKYGKRGQKRHRKFISLSIIYLHLRVSNYTLYSPRQSSCRRQRGGHTRTDSRLPRGSVQTPSTRLISNEKSRTSTGKCSYTSSTLTGTLSRIEVARLPLKNRLRCRSSTVKQKKKHRPSLASSPFDRTFEFD